MILVSVGTQLPFDRLTMTVDDWAVRNGRDDVVAQVGPSTYKPVALRSFPFLEHGQFRQLQLECQLFVSHAGMGSIITAMELGKPIIILARDHRRGEHRNGHQLATIKQFMTTTGVYPAADEGEVAQLLGRADELTAIPRLESSAPPEMIQRLMAYIREPTLASEQRRTRRRFF